MLRGAGPGRAGVVLPKGRSRMSGVDLLWMLVGLVLLVGGAELLVAGASRMAASFGVSPLVVGLTVVAFGTSAPELMVSLVSALGGQGDIALGNAVGSNTFNVLFILGLSSLITPLVVDAKLVRFDIPLMVAASALLAFLARDGVLGQGEGAVLALGLVLYLVALVLEARRDQAAGEPEPAHSLIDDLEGPRDGVARDLASIVAGLLLLVGGSRAFLIGAISVARGLGISELVIGLTLVAAGTSLPEVATSVVAAWRGERDIAVGNVVGSNLFNILCVLGVASLAVPGGIPVPAAALRLDIPVMVAAAALCLPICFTGMRVDRWEGALFLAYYAAYTTYLVLTASGHAGLPSLREAVLYGLLPLTLVPLGVQLWQALPDGHGGRRPEGAPLG